MTAPTPDPSDVARPSHVQVCGNDHSPWVQAVLLGLHEKRIEHTLALAPPLAVFARSGVLMPAARFDDGRWTLDSERILVALGFSAVDHEQRRALQAVFGSGALHRTDGAWTFWHRFSFVRDGDPRFTRRLWHQFWRAFSMFYFFVLIKLAGRRVRRPSRDEIVTQLAWWQGRLGGDALFFGGEAPDTVDLQLFGLVQMCASIPGPSYEAIRTDPELERLRAWIGAMHERYASYEHLYTARAFEPACPEIAAASLAERCAYWAGAASMWLAWPVTVPLVFFFVRRVRRTGMLREDPAPGRRATSE